MSKITVTTIAGATSGADANKVKIESGDTLEVTSNATVGGTLGVTGATTLSSNVGVNGGTGGQVATNFSSASAMGMKINDTNSGNLGGMLGFYSGSGAGTLRANIQNANNAGVHFSVGTGGSIVFTQTGYTAANALDDYEDGSFTPTPVVTHNPGGVSVSNITQQIGKYIKIGSMVFFHFRIRFDKAGSSGNIGINGLPFAEDDSIDYGNIGMAREGATEGTAYQLEGVVGTQIGVMRKYDNTSFGTGTKDVQGHGFYRTSS